MCLTEVWSSSAATATPQWVDVITTLIGTIGFPIAAYCALFWYMIKQNKDHKDEITHLCDVVDKNTDAIQRLADHVSQH